MNVTQRSWQMAAKRKHVTLTLCEKLKIIDLQGSGRSLARISADYSSGKSTDFDILRCKEEICPDVSERGGEDKRKRMRNSDNDTLDKPLIYARQKERDPNKWAIDHAKGIISRFK